MSHCIVSLLYRSQLSQISSRCLAILRGANLGLSSSRFAVSFSEVAKLRRQHSGFSFSVIFNSARNVYHFPLVTLHQVVHLRGVKIVVDDPVLEGQFVQKLHLSPNTSPKWLDA